MLFFKHVAWSLLLCLVTATAGAISSMSIEKSIYDDRDYKGLVLDNGLKVLLVSDPKAEKAAAVLNVAVGSFNDPAEREGLAHFLEHMLFLGTKKYPQASEYSEYISAHGGFNNAWTSNRNTQYYFSILPEHLPGALDRFAHFFIEPLFNAELVDRERHAVNSEYQLSLNQDGWRVGSVDGVTSNPEHPIVRFNMGNIETLGDGGKRKPVREALIEFYDAYYSSERMALVIIGPQSIKDQQALVTEYFSVIPKRQVQPNEISSLVYTKQETAKQIAIQSLGDYKELRLSFPMPSQRDNYLTLPIEYIVSLFQETGPDSLYQKLRAKNWVTDLSASNDDISYVQDRLDVNLTLTNNGQQHIDEIVEYVFSYINFLRKAGPQASIFSDLKLAGNRDFIFAKNMDPVDYATVLGMNLQRYPLAQVLTAGRFTNATSYDSKKIIALLDLLTPENLRLSIINQEVQGDKFEEKYKVKYSVKNFTSEQLKRWQVANSGLKFTLPEKNNFMPVNFNILTNVDKNTPTKFPQEIYTQPGVKLWYKQDDTFAIPKQNLIFLFAAPNMQSSARRAVYLKFMQQAISDNLSELSSQFALAGVNANVETNAQGLILKLNMFSDKQRAVVQSTLRYILDYKIDPQRFNVYKENITRELINFKQLHPFRQAATILGALVKDPSWLPEEMLLEIDKITTNQVEEYMQQFLQQIQIESLMHGNIGKTTANNLVKMVAQQMRVDKQQLENLALPKLVTLKDASNLYYGFAPEHNDATVVSYYQARNTDDKTIAVNALLVDLLSVPLFEQLRTKEQLGYVVGLKVFRLRNQTGQMFFIESPSKSANYLNERLALFIKTFKTKLQAMRTEELDVYKSSLQANLLQKPTSLPDESERYWDKIIDGTYRFDFEEEIAKQVTSISQADISEYFKTLWLDSKTQRRISVVSINNKHKFVGAKQIKDLSYFKSGK